MNKCENTCFQRWAVLVQFVLNLNEFCFSNNGGLHASRLWLVAVCKLQAMQHPEAFTIFYVSPFIYYSNQILYAFLL